MNKTKRVFKGTWIPSIPILLCIYGAPKTWLRRDLSEHWTLQSTVESRFGGLVANVNKQQCQLCRQEGKRLIESVQSLRKQALRVGRQYGKTALSTLSPGT